MSGGVVLELELPPRLEAITEARAALEPWTRRLPREARADLELLTTEVVTNSVLHGSPARDAPISLRVREERDRLRIEVRDGGSGFTPPAGAPDPRATSGRGLVLVDRIARSWGIERSPRTCVWFEVAA